MRSDYVLYVVAIIFFIMTGVVLVSTIEFRELWIVSTSVLGLFFVGLGYLQRPRPKTVITVAPPPIAAPSAAATATEVGVEEKKVETSVEVVSPRMRLTRVKGIGAKRAGQLKAAGASNVEDLANASANDLAAKLQIPQKTAGRWITEAKELAKKSK